MTSVTTPADFAIIKTEMFDADMMNDLLSLESISSQTRQQLKMYKKRRQNGNVVQVIYQHSKIMNRMKVGRLYAAAGMGYQMLPSDIRNALGNKYYWDIDMVNAQPVILHQLCEQNGWKCDNLKDYVDNRAARLAEIMSKMNYNRNEAKDLCISVMFGSRPQYCLPWITELAKELEQIGKSIVAIHPEILKACSKQPNPRASCVAHVCQEIECKILLHLDSMLQSMGRQMDSLIYDGGLVRKLDGELEFPVELFQQLEDGIRNYLGYNISLAVKPMVHSFAFVKPERELIRIGNAEGGVTEREYLECKDRFEENHFYCSETESIVTIKGSQLFHCTRGSAPVTFSSYNFQKIHNHKITTHIFVTEWLNDKTKRTVDKLIFQPNLSAEIAEGCYNMFTGMDGAANTECAEGDAVVERFKLLVEQNAGKNAEMFEYMLKWYALAVQKPHVIPGVALVLINTLQGTGKDTVGWFFGSKVVGNEHYANIKNVETELFDSHSTAFDRTLFMKMEEVNGSLNRKFSDMLKSMITAPTATINPKGTKKYEIAAFPHIVMTTNNAVPVKVEQGDRRFCISYTAADYVGQSDFWTETYRMFELEGAGNAVFRFLSQMDLTGFVSQRFPKSDYHEALTETEVPSEKQYMQECEAFDKKSGTTLHTEYQDWCRDNRVEPKSCVHFCRSLAPLIEQGLVVRRMRDGKSWYSKPEEA
jgi:hypothetical protein